MFRALFAIIFAILFLIIGSPALGIEYLIGKRNKAKADLSSLRIVQWAFRVIYNICGVRLTIIGKERIPQDAPVLYVCNHKSYFDIIIGYAQCDGLTGYIAKDSIERVPILAAWMRRLYCLFLKRDDPRQSLKTIQTAISYVKNGISICIFPEGTRNPDPTLLPFKEGSLRIAEKTGCPIIPMAISNTSAIIKDHMPFVKPTHVILEYGDPIYPATLTREEKKKLGAKTQAIVQTMLDQHQQMLTQR